MVAAGRVCDFVQPAVVCGVGWKELLEVECYFRGWKASYVHWGDSAETYQPEFGELFY